MPIKRLSKVAREFNLGISTIVEFLSSKGIEIEAKPNTKISEEHYNVLSAEFQDDKSVKEESQNVSMPSIERESVSIENPQEKSKSKEEDDSILIKNIPADKEIEAEKEEIKEVKEEVFVEAVIEEEKGDDGLKVVGKIDLDSMNLKSRPDRKSKAQESEKKKKEEKEELAKTEVTKTEEVKEEKVPEEKIEEKPKPSISKEHKTDVAKLEGLSLIHI